MKQWQPVEYVGPEDGSDEVWQGQPGRVIDPAGPGRTVIVAFVNGPSVEIDEGDVAPLTEREYLDRGQRVAALQHPLRDQPIPRVNLAGDEWPDQAPSR